MLGELGALELGVAINSPHTIPTFSLECVGRIRGKILRLTG